MSNPFRQGMCAGCKTQKYSPDYDLCTSCHSLWKRQKVNANGERLCFACKARLSTYDLCKPCRAMWVAAQNNTILVSSRPPRDPRYDQKNPFSPQPFNQTPFHSQQTSPYNPSFSQSVSPNPDPFSQRTTRFNQGQSSSFAPAGTPFTQPNPGSFSKPFSAMPNPDQFSQRTTRFNQGQSSPFAPTGTPFAQPSAAPPSLSQSFSAPGYDQFGQRTTKFNQGQPGPFAPTGTPFAQPSAAPPSLSQSFSTPGYDQFGKRPEQFYTGQITPSFSQSVPHTPQPSFQQQPPPFSGSFGVSKPGYEIVAHQPTTDVDRKRKMSELRTTCNVSFSDGCTEIFVLATAWTRDFASFVLSFTLPNNSLGMAVLSLFMECFLVYKTIIDLDFDRRVISLKTGVEFSSLPDRYEGSSISEEGRVRSLKACLEAYKPRPR